MRPGWTRARCRHVRASHGLPCQCLFVEQREEGRRPRHGCLGIPCPRFGGAVCSRRLPQHRCHAPVWWQPVRLGIVLDPFPASALCCLIGLLMDLASLMPLLSRRARIVLLVIQGGKLAIPSVNPPPSASQSAFRLSNDDASDTCPLSYPATDSCELSTST